MPKKPSNSTRDAEKTGMAECSGDPIALLAGCLAIEHEHRMNARGGLGQASTRKRAEVRKRPGPCDDGL
jgi:hypothetical protein